MQVLVIGVSALLGLALAGGYLGALHPVGDGLAVFRVPLAVAFALVVIWTGWPRRVRWPLAALALAALVPHATDDLLDSPPSGPADLTLYQQNLLFSRKETQAWLDVLDDLSPDVLTLQEINHQNEHLLETLRAAGWANILLCLSEASLREAVLSRLPVVDGSERCSKRHGISAFQVVTDAGPVWVASVHLSWPWPYPQWQQVPKLVPFLESLEGPVVLAGDFNSVAWSRSVRQLARASRAQRLGPYHHTFDLPYLGLPIGIDHVLATGGQGRVTVMERLGSDHNGLYAEILLP